MDDITPIRYHWIDNLKFFALFLVVFGHVGTSPFHDVVYGFHMPLFFVLSGMLHKDKRIGSICIRLLVPYLLFNILYLLAEFPWLYKQNGNFAFVVYDFIGIVFPMEHPIDYPTWFLLSLFEIKIIIKLLRNNVLMSFAMALMLISICCLLNYNFQAPFFLKNTLVGLVFYDFGYIVHAKLKNQIIVYKHSLLCVLGGVSVALYVFLMIYVPSCNWNEAIGNPYQFLYSLLACCGFVLLFQGTFCNKYKIVEQSCIGGIAIIGFHPLFIQYLRRFIQIFGGTWNNMNFTEMFCVSLVVMILCMATIPLVRKYFPLLIGLNKRKL